MGQLARIGRNWHLLTLGLLVLLWLGLSGLLVLARGRPEALLTTAFRRFSRDHSLEYLDGVSVDFCWVHSFLVVVGSIAIGCRRNDVLVVLMIGPIMALAFALLGQQWTDPN